MAYATTWADATEPRIASLCTGTGMLDQAVMDIFGGTVVWHCQYDPDDKHQLAARILAHHWPSVPNLGDMTAVDWVQVLAQYGRIDVLTAGFPCQDVSAAGLRAGIAEGTRSGLWAHVALAISALRPRLLVIENVEGLLSAPANRGLGLDDEALDEEAAAGRVLRALGAVLGDLADLGFDAEWRRVAASDVGAPHRRYRIVILAWPAAAHADSDEPERWGVAGVLGGPTAEEPGQGHQRQRTGHPAGHRGAAAADTTDLVHERSRDARRRGHGPANRSVAPTHTDDLRRRTDVLGLRPGQPDLDWGDYAPAILRWEEALGRPAPWPTDLRGRLSPVFSEWMMGYPDGWVTAVPGLTRRAMLRALGNGVVRQQMVHGIRLAWWNAFAQDVASLDMAA